jgi:hypothetical protein
MDAKAIHEAVARLHTELAEAGSLTPELRAELSVALRDVERALGRHERPLAARAEELAARLEAEHPKLAESISALVRGLAGIGI